MAFCSGCGTQIADGTTMCPACSSRTAAPPAAAAQGSTGGMSDNVVGMLCYVTIVPAIIFLVMEPYNKSRFVRFHAFQMIFFSVAWIVIWIALSLSGWSRIGLADSSIWPLLGLGWLDYLDHSADQSQPGPDVQTASGGRSGGETSQRHLIWVADQPLPHQQPVSAVTLPETGSRLPRLTDLLRDVIPIGFRFLRRDATGAESSTCEGID